MLYPTELRDHGLLFILRGFVSQAGYRVLRVDLPQKL